MEDMLTEDAMLSGTHPLIDRANRAMLAAEQAGHVLTDDRESVSATEAAPVLNLVREAKDAARFAAQAAIAEREDLAARFAEHCEAKVTELRSFDTARFNGIMPHRAESDQGDLIDGSGSAGGAGCGTYAGYKKRGCRCEPCREANRAKVREARARKRAES